MAITTSQSIREEISGYRGQTMNAMCALHQGIGLMLFSERLRRKNEPNLIRYANKRLERSWKVVIGEKII